MESKGDAIATWFSKKLYRIPIYQRRYVWNKDNWEPVWKDIIRKTILRLGNKATDHFTGTVITRILDDKKSNIPQYYIIDGQQRLTTFQLILCAIRDICNELSSRNGVCDDLKDKYDTIAKETKSYIINVGAEEEEKYKLYPKEGLDKDTFCKLIDDSSKCQPSTHKIYRAFKYFKVNIKDFVGEDFGKIETLYETIIYDFRMIEIDVKEWDDPEKLFAIFHIPGRILDEFDWLRNDLFLRAEADRDNLYKIYWSHFDTDTYWEEPETQESFFRTFLMAKLGPNGFNNDEKLFDVYDVYQNQQKLLNGDRNIEKEFEELRKYAQTYKNLDDPEGFKTQMQLYRDLSDFKNKDKYNSDFVSRHHYYVALVRALILYLQNELEDPLGSYKISKVFEILESYVVRNLLVRSVGNCYAYEEIESYFLNLFGCRKFIVEDMVNYFAATANRRWISNEVVINWFKGYAFQNEGGGYTQAWQFTERYILYRIENWERKNRGKEPISFEDFPTHRVRVQNKKQLPTNEEEAWSSFGNITYSWQAGGRSGIDTFEDIKKFMKENNDCELILNQEICNKDKWRSEEIEEREEKLLDTFFDIWKSVEDFSNDNISWKVFVEKHSVGDVVEGSIVDIDTHSVTLQLESDVQGVIPLNEMIWTNKGLKHIYPSQIFSLGQTSKAKILKISKMHKSLILSSKQMQPNPWENKYEVGSVVRGRIVSLTDFGALAELEKGIQGLIHKSQLANRKVERPEEIVSDQEELDLKIIRVGPESKKINLSLKAASWEKFAEKNKVGSVVQGKICSIMDFGAFAELEKGIEGFIPKSELSNRRINNPEEIVSVGDELDLKVIRVDPEERKIDLSLKAPLPDPWMEAAKKYEVGAVVWGKIINLATFGALVELEEGIKGIIYNSELTHQHVRTPAEIVSIGEELDLKVIEVKPQTRRISLSLKAVVK